MELILGSNSPRRREILNFFSIPFKQQSPDFDEAQVIFQGDPAAFAAEVAHRKALCLTEKYPNDVILTADTVVYRQKRLFLSTNGQRSLFLNSRCYLSLVDVCFHFILTRRNFLLLSWLVVNCLPLFEMHQEVRVGVDDSALVPTQPESFDQAQAFMFDKIGDNE